MVTYRLTNSLFLGVTVVCFVIMGRFAFAQVNDKMDGIYPIGGDAVYIAGEACTVNMTTLRTEEAIINDMMECISLHRKEK